jgi:hypothetical protein
MASSFEIYATDAVKDVGRGFLIVATIQHDEVKASRVEWYLFVMSHTDKLAHYRHQVVRCLTGSAAGAAPASPRIAHPVSNQFGARMAAHSLRRIRTVASSQQFRRDASRHFFGPASFSRSGRRFFPSRAASESASLVMTVSHNCTALRARAGRCLAYCESGGMPSSA